MLVVLFLLSSSSCIPQKELVCNVGMDGISASFTRETMRQVYDENVMYPFVVEIKNRGAYNSQVYFQISHNKDLLTINPEVLTTDYIIEGKAPWNECTGSIRREVFEITPTYLPVAVQDFRTEISLNVCYEYRTDLNTTLCVHNNIGQINAIGANCKYGDKNFGGGQGAPLGFVRAEAPVFLSVEGIDRIRVRLYLRNYQNGNIVASADEGLENACSRRTGNLSDMIRVEGYLDQYELNCNLLTSQFVPDGYTQLRPDPQRVVRNDVETVLKDYYLECETIDPVELNSAREMSLNIKAEYHYRELGVETRTINIRKI